MKGKVSIGDIIMDHQFKNVKKNFGFGCMRFPMNGEQVDYEETILRRMRKSDHCLKASFLFAAWNILISI